MFPTSAAAWFRAFWQADVGLDQSQNCWTLLVGVVGDQAVSSPLVDVQAVGAEVVAAHTDLRAEAAIADEDALELDLLVGRARLLIVGHHGLTHHRHVNTRVALRVDNKKEEEKKAEEERTMTNSKK